MLRYDGPDFEAEGETIVSVWAAKCPLAEVPEDYFEEDYEGGDEDPFNRFCSDFGFGLYDHDFTESAALPGPASIEAIVRDASYGASFSAEVARRSTIQTTEHVFLMYGFRYDPNVTGIRESSYYRFVGVYEYHEDA